MVRPPRVDGPESSWPPGRGRPYAPPDASTAASRADGQTASPLDRDAPRCGARRQRVSPSRSSPSRRRSSRGRCRAALPDPPRRPPCSSGPWPIAAGGSLLVSGAGRLAVAADRRAIGRRPARTARPRPRRPAGRRHRRRRQPEPRRTARSRAGRRAVRGRGPPRDGPAHGDPPGRVRRGKPGPATGGPDRAPLDRAARDADRLRHGLGEADLDFIARVHAAIVIADAPVTRSPACAVITRDQVPAWIASLPRQRSLTERRRRAWSRSVRTAAAEDARRGW